MRGAGFAGSTTTCAELPDHAVDLKLGKAVDQRRVEGEYRHRDRDATDQQRRLQSVRE
jgi:hypothetical protein